MKFAWIAVEKASFRVSQLCRVLDVTPSGYYAWVKRPASARAQRDRRLKVLVRASFDGSKQRYGSPRIHRDLVEQDEPVSRKRVIRLMQEDGLTARVRKRFKRTTVEDLGNGNVLGPTLGLDEAGAGLPREATVQASLAAGYDVVCVSGDKLLGGPQAGLVLGRADLIDRLRRHPLMRAFRVDKLTYAALEATLLEHVAGRASATVPVAAMIAMPRAAIAARAAALADRLRGVGGLATAVVDGVSTIGGGSAPGSALPTALLALALAGCAPDDLLARLRTQATPLIARIEDDRVVLDLRTVRPDEDEELARLIAEVAAPTTT